MSRKLMTFDYAFEKYYNKQSEKHKHRMNELIIWAVNKMQDNNAHVSGSKIFLKKRIWQLVNELRYNKWRDASNRLRVSVNQWIQMYSVST